MQITSTPQGNLSSINASVGGSPTIIAQPQSQVAQTSMVASFSFVASGSQPLFQQWYFNNIAIPGATNDSLLILAVSPADFGSYYVIAANSLGVATSIVAQLQLDADGDGLADSWEIANFGSITNQNGMGDFDGDGNSNLREFMDGTSPTNHNSLLPRLVVRSIGGDVLLSPNRDHYNLGDQVALQAAPDPGLTLLCWSGDVSGANPNTNLVMNGDKFVQATFGLPLNAALDVTNVFTTYGDGGWYGQTNDSYDGVSAARTAPIVPHSVGNSVSWLQTTATMAIDGTVSFWWRSDTSSGNSVAFVIDNSSVGLLDDVTPWQHQVHYLAAGTHTLKWIYTHRTETWPSNSPYTLTPQDSVYVDQLVIKEYTDPTVDTDGDGLPDIWEYKYFDTLAYGPSDDPDRDGVNNLNEFLDGTRPNSISSVLPRLSYVIEGGGSAIASPNLPKYAYNQFVTNIATPYPGWGFVAWRFLTPTSLTTKTNNPYSLQILASTLALAIFGRPLAEVTDAPTLTWTNGGELGWYGQTNISRDGVSAARSGPISATGESWMETTVTGPGTLSFWWKVDSTTNIDQLSFLINTVTQPGSISGVVDWQEQTYYLGAGPQTFRWRFKRNNGGDTNRLAAAWVDQVQFLTGDVTPSFVQQPANQTVVQVSNAAVQVLARGTPPINYQLYFGSTPYGQPTTSTTLIITNPPTSLTGTWTVKASNAGGVASSSPFTLTVLPAPPSNDNFAGRFSLPVGQVVTGYNFAATKEPGEPNHAGATGGASVWWSWVAPQSGMFRAVAQSTNSSDTLALGVYTGSAVNSLVPMGTTSFTTTNDPNGGQIQAAADTFTAAAGSSYAIAVDTYSASGLWFNIWVDYLPPPLNDMFASRTVLTGASVSDSTQNRTATAEPGEPAHVGFPAANSVWWTWTAPHNGAVVVNVTGDSFIPRAAVYTGSSLATLHQVAAGFGGGTNGNTILNFNAASGTPYQIAADGFFGSTGNIQINVALAVPSFTAPAVNQQGKFNFSIQGPAGSAFVIETSNNMQTWSPVFTGTIPASGHFDFQTAIAPGPHGSFYRVRM